MSFDFISYPMGWVLGRLSDLLGNNFAASVIVFTLLINLAMLPLTLKSQKSTAKQARLKPKLDALKKKYGNDKQKYSQAMNELYTKEKVSMSGGCLPMIIRMVVLMGVYWAVVSPLQFVQMVDKGAINEAKSWVSYTRVAESKDSTIDWAAAGLGDVVASDTVVELSEKYGAENAEYFGKLIIVEKANAMKKDDVKKDSVEAKIRDLTKKKQVLREVELVDFLSANPDGTDKYPVIANKFTAKGGNLEDVRKTNFNLFGLKLTDTPEFSWNLTKFQPIWLIPILSFATAMLSSVISMLMQKKINPDAPNMAFMMLMMPLFSLYIAFTVPGAVGFYWACSNVISGGLQVLTQFVYGPNVVIAKEQAKAVIDRDKQERARIAACTTPTLSEEEK